VVRHESISVFVKVIEDQLDVTWWELDFQLLEAKDEITFWDFAWVLHIEESERLGNGYISLLNFDPNQFQ
jgi:hypothetical protein